MNLKKWNELKTGGINLESGNSAENLTGFLRKGEKPVFNAENCINCFFCWVFCPDNAIIVDNEKVCGINYDYCKGCKICENECPVTKEPKPIVIIPESVEL